MIEGFMAAWGIVGPALGFMFGFSIFVAAVCLVPILLAIIIDL